MYEDQYGEFMCKQWGRVKAVFKLCCHSANEYPRGLQQQIQTFRGGTRSPINFFWGLWASVWSKNKGGGKAPESATVLFSQQVIYFEGLMTVIFISSQHFTKATKVLQKGKGMVERVNQWRQMQTMKYDACVLKTDVQKKF